MPISGSRCVALGLVPWGEIFASSVQVVCTQVDKEHRFDVGSVDEMGIAAKGEAAVGWPCFIMTKVRSSYTSGLLGD